MAGGFVAVVGPSGAGKDTLIDLSKAALVGDDRFWFPRRLVTRPAGPFEDHDSLDWPAFERGEAEGLFALSWRAHGLGYAIPGAARREAEAGRVVVCNLSRAVLDEARSRLPGFAAVEVTAPREVLAARLVARGRAEDGDIGRRIERSAAIAHAPADLVIVNDRRPEDGASLLVAFLKARAARQGSLADLPT